MSFNLYQTGSCGEISVILLPWFICCCLLLFFTFSGKREQKEKIWQLPLPPHAAHTEEINKVNIHKAGATKRAKEEMARRAARDASTCLGAIQASVRLAPVQDSFGSSSRPIGVTWRCFKAPIMARVSASFSGLELMLGRVRSVSFYSLLPFSEYCFHLVLGN